MSTEYSPEASEEEEPCLTTDSVVNGQSSSTSSEIQCNGGPIQNDQNPKTGTASHRKRRRRSADSSNQIILQIDRRNFCILSFLFLLLVIIIAVIAYVLGQWIGISRNLKFGGGNRSEENRRNFQGDFASSVLELWRRRDKSRGGTSVTPIRRLPRDVIPISYDLHLNLVDYASTKTISGQVTILLECMNSTKEIVLNAAGNLEISSGIVAEGKTGRKVPLNSLGRDSKNPVIFKIESEEYLSKGRFYKLSLTYKTTICNSRSGVYCYRLPRTPSRVSRGVSAWGSNSATPLSLTTKLEPTLAKSLFPCWDEPDFKAIFNISITHPADTKVLSNAAVFKQTSNPEKNLATDYFHETPPMSTYLLAMAVGPFVAIEKESDRGIKVSIWTLPEDHYKAEYACHYAVHMFNVLEDYFVVKYPLSKLDMVASRNFPVGGMENWGLIIFHYDILLLNEDQEGSGEVVRLQGETEEEFEYLLPKYRTSKIIIHELVHQWFGNLVTMSWWSDLWLNEGFTSFFANHFVSKTFPMLAEYEYYTRLGELWARQTYGQKLPLVQEFETEEAISESFDQWNLYCKGSVAVKLLWDLLGERTLRGGVINYLRQHAYGTVIRQDLYRQLSRTSHFVRGNVEIGSVMESWVTHPGFPEIHVERNYEERVGEITVRQRTANSIQNQIFLREHKGHNQKSNLTWKIPFVYIAQSQLRRRRQPFWVCESSFTFQDLDLKNTQWLLANPNFQFPYRINYDRRNWYMLVHQLYRNPKALSGRSRTQLILDAGLFLKESHDLPMYIELLGYLRKETELLPLLIGLQSLCDLLDMFRATPIYPLLLVYFRPIAGVLVKRRNDSYVSSEEYAVWNLDERRMKDFYIFRCAVNHESCRVARTRAQQVLAAPGTGLKSLYISVCQFLYNHLTESEKIIILEAMERKGGESRILSILGSCIREDSVIETLSTYLVKGGNMVLLTEVFGVTFSLHFNRDFRISVLRKLTRLSRNEKSKFFKSEKLTRMFLLALRTTEELELAKAVVPGLESEKEFLSKKFRWIQSNATPQLQSWLLQTLNL